MRSVIQSIALARCLAPKVALIGFSTGGLLALRAAEIAKPGMIATVAINPSLQLRDRLVHLARPLDRWNHLAARCGLPTLDAVRNRPAWADTNYTANPLHSLAELMRLIAIVRRSPPRPRGPVLLLQADNDDVVVPAGVVRLGSLIGGTAEIERIAGDRHVCLRGEGAETTWRRVAEFLDHVTGHLHPSGRIRHVG
jgi:alpha-beta hydrolase superfamily lysophospholipase